MVSMRSIGLASRSSCRTAHLQNDATAARLRLRMAGVRPAISPRNAGTGAADSSPIWPPWQAADAVRSPRYARIVLRGLFAFARSVRKSSSGFGVVVGEQVGDLAGGHGAVGEVVAGQVLGVPPGRPEAGLIGQGRRGRSGVAAATLTTRADLPRLAACARRFLSCSSVSRSSASVSMNNVTNRGCMMFLLSSRVHAAAASRAWAGLCGGIGRPPGRISPMSSNTITPLHSRLHPCSG